MLIGGAPRTFFPRFPRLFWDLDAKDLKSVVLWPSGFSLSNRNDFGDEDGSSEGFIFIGRSTGIYGGSGGSGGSGSSGRGIDSSGSRGLRWGEG